MNNSNNSIKNEARAERRRRQQEADLVSARFPSVEGVVVSMTYSQRGVLNPVPRKVHFSPGSSALFIISCLSKECVDGGFDLTQIITGMIDRRKATAQGCLGCEGGNSPAGHSKIDYEVAITYRPER